MLDVSVNRRQYLLEGKVIRRGDSPKGKLSGRGRVGRERLGPYLRAPARFLFGHV